jgi:hypothetical protein
MKCIVGRLYLTHRETTVKKGVEKRCCENGTLLICSQTIVRAYYSALLDGPQGGLVRWGIKEERNIRVGIAAPSLKKFFLSPSGLPIQYFFFTSLPQYTGNSLSTVNDGKRSVLLFSFP